MLRRYSSWAATTSTRGLRLARMTSRRVSSTRRVRSPLDNALDTRYAERADFAGRDYRYLPGRGRAFFAELRFSPSVTAD